MIIFEHISYFEMISVERVKSGSINYAVYVVRYKRCVMIGPFKWLFLLRVSRCSSPFKTKTR